MLNYLINNILYINNVLIKKHASYEKIKKTYQNRLKKGKRLCCL